MMNEALPTVLISEERVRARVEELAAAISRDFAGAQELLLVGVLKGAFIFLADLARRITIPHMVDFITTSHYGSGVDSAKEIRLVFDMRAPVAGRPVLLVEDILDTGYTLRFLVELFRGRKPSVLKTCVLVQKTVRLQVDFRADYVGFEIPDVWAVGYGLDCADRWRTLPYVGAVSVERKV